MARSLRWKLLAWYTLAMGALACVFGGLLYRSVRDASRREIDARLERHASDLVRVIVPLGGERFEMELSSQQVKDFSGQGAGALHYAIWTADGLPIDASNPTLAVPPPAATGGRDRAAFRELSIRGPENTWVLVGQEVSGERDALGRLAATAVGAGLGALGLMLAGGWFLTSRALRPIDRITSAASAVSASNLSERIDAERMETELAELAGTINDAFDRLQQAFEQQTRFTADASHELRTPLSIVLSQAELALRQPREPGEYREMIDAIRRSAKRMKAVVEGLLTLARADAGQAHLNIEDFDMAEVVRETCGLFRPVAAEREISISENLQSCIVRGDRGQLAEAVSNLVSNAAKYNRPGGAVEASLIAVGQEVVLSIADTGPGISEADRAHIFERFYRVDKARSREVDGSGLGLAIVKWIVDAHGGTIACRDRQPEGTVFEVRLPASRAEDLSEHDAETGN